MWVVVFFFFCLIIEFFPLTDVSKNGANFCVVYYLSLLFINN